MLRTVMSSIMRRRRGLISAIWKLLTEGWDRHPHPLRQETCHATKPLTPRQRLRSIPRARQECAVGEFGAPFAWHARVSLTHAGPSAAPEIHAAHRQASPVPRAGSALLVAG